MAHLLLTVIGADRPGLVRTLAETVAAHGGSWLESRMGRLAGQFAGIVLVDAPDSLLDSLLQDLHALEVQGLRISVQTDVDHAAAPPVAPRLALEVVGNDRPGIVRDITRILWDCGVNIEEFVTGVADGSFTGGTLFRVTAMLRVPNADAVKAVRAALEELGNELMVDIQPAGEASAA